MLEKYFPNISLSSKKELLKNANAKYGKSTGFEKNNWN